MSAAGNMQLAAAVAPATSYSAAILAHSPAMYLRLGEASGTTAADASGNSRTGTYSATDVTLGTASLLTGDANTAVTMSGTGLRLSVPYGAWMDGDRTVECIIKPSDITDAAGSTPMSQSNQTANSWHIEIYLSNLYLFVAGGYATGSVAVSVNTRYHLAYRVSGSTSTLLLNGVQVLSRAFAPTEASPFRAGTRFDTPTGPFLGVADEVSWIPSALSDAQILVHAQKAGLA